MPCERAWSTMGHRPSGQTFWSTNQSPSPALSSRRPSNQPSSSTTRSTPTAAALSTRLSSASGRGRNRPPPRCSAPAASAGPGAPAGRAAWRGRRPRCRPSPRRSRRSTPSGPGTPVLARARFPPGAATRRRRGSRGAPPRLQAAVRSRNADCRSTPHAPPRLPRAGSRKTPCQRRQDTVSRARGGRACFPAPGCRNPGDGAAGSARVPISR